MTEIRAIDPCEPARREAVLITGAAGYVGGLVTRALAEARGRFRTIVASDVRAVPEHERLDGVIYRQLDIRSAELGEAIAEFGIDTVVHLAAIVSPRPGDDRSLQYSVDVQGTRNLLEACVAHDVGKLVYTSSGAAYGYSPDNAALLREEDPLRGNEIFAYSWHKRLVEELLDEYRHAHPNLGQVVLRVSTVLGSGTRNQITALFERKVVVGIKGVDSPFCFIWDQDLVACIVEAVHGARTGVFNITGDGVLTLREIATMMGRRYLGIDERLLTGALAVLNRRGWVPYGPEQVLFLRHRPVLANERLKRDFGYRPRKTTREVFEVYRSSHG